MAWLFIALIGCVLLLAVIPAASHAAAQVARDEGEPTFSVLETGGWSAKVGLTNLTDSPLQLSVGSVRPVVAGACTVQFDTGPTAALLPARDEAVTVTYSEGCKIGQEGATLRLMTSAKPSQVLELEVDPPAEAPKPDWGLLWAFVAALVAALIALLVMLFTNDHMTLGTRLTHLPTTWSFTESWATNVTAGGGILAGVIGSTEVVKAFLGMEADSSIALAIVGVAVAGGFLAFGALLVQSFKYTDSESPTAAGFILGASCTLAGAYGELVTLYATGKALDLGGWQHRLLPIVLVIGAVLALYAYVSVRATLEVGTTPSPPAPLSEGTVAAVYLASKYDRGIKAEEAFRRIEARLAPEVVVEKRADRKLWLREGAEKVPALAKRTGAALL